jgi:hypothetical protein
MPYPNEHACRLNDPGKYDEFRRDSCGQKHDGKCIDVIYGIKEGAAEVQALRYKKDVWSVADARAHCSSRNGSFEAASDKDGEVGAEEDKVGEVSIEKSAVARKTVALKGMKLTEKGTFSALFAPYNNVDKQGDLTLPGAFGERQDVIISAYGHMSWEGSLPVGKGVIHDGDEGGVVEGQFFLDTDAGLETYKTVKNVGELQEWSYSLPEIDYEYRDVDGRQVRILKHIKVNEVSPVLMGAGNGTRTMTVKDGMPFVEELEKMLILAEDVYDRLRGRIESREAAFRNPSAADMKRALVMRERLDGLSRKLGDVIARHDKYDAVLKRFSEITGKEGAKT